MPIASPGRYQSKLFRFLHRQSQQMRDRIGRTIRQVQVSTSWSIEAFVYQSFLLVKKAVNLAGKQLNGQTSNNQYHRNQLNQSDGGIEVKTTPTADAPILHMLEMVRNLPSRQTITSIEPKQPPINYIDYHQTESVNEIVKATLPTVQGIATHLGNRHLVLVTGDNKIIDILTLKQQQRLQDRIIDEIAEYWRLRRLAFDNQVIEQKKILPEIDRLLRKITGSNLATLPEAEISGLEKEVKSDLPSVEQIELIDAAMAKFERTLVPVSRIAITVQQGSLQLFHVAKEKLNLFLYGSDIARLEGVEDLENQTSQIQALIWEAVNHFFGTTSKVIVGNQNDSSNKSIGKRLSARQAIAALPKFRQPKKNIEDPWLTFDDLFAESPTHKESTIPENLEPPYQSQNSLLPSKKANPRLLKQYQAGGELVTQTKSSHLAIKSPKSVKVTTPKPNTSKISVFDNRSNHIHNIDINNEVEFTTQAENTDFIEIKANTVGYDKHPLELILEWLDSLMLWLEDKFVRVIRFIRGIGS